MSKASKLFVLCAAALVFTSCTKNDDKKKVNITPQAKKEDPAEPQKEKTCIPESDLLAPPTAQGIVGGDRVTEYDSDSKKVLMLYSSGELCTAAAIASNVLLTAAHCVNGSSDKALVFVHTSLSCESGFDIREHSLQVSEMLVHEKYNKYDSVSKMQGDVALIFLKQDIPDGYPIYKLADPDFLNESNTIYFYGYGAVGYKKGGAGILRKTQLSRANYSIKKDEKKIVLDQSNGTGICSGDSGGPGLVNIDGELQILGVNSYVSGNPDGDLCQAQAALTLADSYRSWIEARMNERGRSLRK